MGDDAVTAEVKRTKRTRKGGTREANLPETIARELRELITRGTFPPGLQLRQMELADRFESSRVPLREALKLLCAEGIVDHDPNRGFFVAPLSVDEARQLYRMRHLLEAEVLRTVQWPSKDALRALRKQLEQLEAALQDRDRNAWLVGYRGFYQSIFDLSPEKVLVAEVLRLIRLTDRYRALAAEVLPSSERHVEQERQLLEVLEKRDRRRLLRVFDKERTRIEEGIQSVLRGRGL